MLTTVPVAGSEKTWRAIPSATIRSHLWFNEPVV
jgi:hypothetical protein